jgi:hypothetical protein
MGAVVAFFAAIFTKDLDEGTGGIWPSDLTRGALDSAFRNKFNNDTLAFEAVYEENVRSNPMITGWSFRSRLGRAAIIADGI